MASSPVVAITGPRTAGKSTLAIDVVERTSGTFIDLDDPGVRRLAMSDPGAFVRDPPEPVVIDEFQRVPDLPAAIKSELNRDRRPGRFVLAGSARHEAVPELADFLTGRVELLRLWPFAMAELEPAAPSIVDRLFGDRPRSGGSPTWPVLTWSTWCCGAGIPLRSASRSMPGTGGWTTSPRWWSSGSPMMWPRFATPTGVPPSSALPQIPRLFWAGFMSQRGGCTCIFAEVGYANEQGRARRGRCR